jgi:DNA-binding NarL/FixJ family response regulator
MSALHAARANYELDIAAAMSRELGDESRPFVTSQVQDLTRREVEVLRLLGQGLTNAEIAGRLFVSIKTAGNHVSDILMKLACATVRRQPALARTRLGQEQGIE